jgi:hypothetical protein
MQFNSLVYILRRCVVNVVPAEPMICASCMEHALPVLFSSHFEIVAADKEERALSIATYFLQHWIYIHFNLPSLLK